MRELGRRSARGEIIAGETFHVSFQAGVTLGRRQDLPAQFEHLGDGLAGAPREQGQFAPGLLGHRLKTRLGQRQHRFQRQRRADDMPISGFLECFQR